MVKIIKHNKEHKDKIEKFWENLPKTIAEDDFMYDPFDHRETPNISEKQVYRRPEDDYGSIYDHEPPHFTPKPKKKYRLEHRTAINPCFDNATRKAYEHQLSLMRARREAIRV